MQNYGKNIVQGWYEPHSRATDYTGEIINTITGEVSRPPSMTKQEFVAECDINNIVKEYLMTGQIAHISAKAAQGVFDDLPDSMDYQQALHLVRDSDAMFAQLPSGVRNRFNNDPEQFLAFCGDPANAGEMISLGLATPREPLSAPDSNLGEAVKAPPDTKPPA